MESVKCPSCGAYQNINDKCEYCGIKLQLPSNNKKVLSEEMKSFKLALFEFENENYGKSSMLFDELIKKDSDLFIAWVYKVMSDFLSSYSFRVDFASLLKNIKRLVAYSGNESNLKYLEKQILFLIEKIYLRDNYLDDYNNEIRFQQYVWLKRGTTYFSFFEFINSLSQLFSLEFSRELTRILIKYFEYFTWPHLIISTESEICAEEFNDISILELKSILAKNSEVSNQLLKAILECNISRCENKIYQNRRDGKPVGFSKEQIDSILLYSKKLAEAFFEITEIKNEHLLNDFESKLNSFPEKVLNNNSSKEKSGCFIATAAMGDYDHPVVVDLRLFRDNWLSERKWGNNFISWYYVKGPKAAKFIEKSNILKKMTFMLIIKPLHLLTKRTIKNGQKQK